MLSPDGDTYHIRLAYRENASGGRGGNRRAAAVLSAVGDSLCACAAVPADAAVVRVPAAAQPPSPDYLVLVNKRSALAEHWADALDLVTTRNSDGGELRLERTVCKAYFKLREALAAEGVAIDLAAAFGGDGEHSTGLALDLRPVPESERDAVYARLAEYGFILRYPEGKEAITGYAYEPWHVRFVGVRTATEIAGQGVTLEEYLHAA